MQTSTKSQARTHTISLQLFVGFISILALSPIVTRVQDSGMIAWHPSRHLSFPSQSTGTCACVRTYSYIRAHTIAWACAHVMHPASFAERCPTLSIFQSARPHDKSLSSWSLEEGMYISYDYASSAAIYQYGHSQLLVTSPDTRTTLYSPASAPECL